MRVPERADSVTPLMFDGGMDAAFTTIDRGLTDLAAVDLAVLTAEEIGRGILAMQAHIDRERVIQARWMAEGKQRGLFTASGHRDGAAWLAAKGKTSVGSAKRQAGLSDAMAASPALADAVESGTISPDTAEALQPTLASNHSGNLADLIDACAGATPAEARAAGSEFQLLYPPPGQTAADREHELRKKRFLRFRRRGDGLTDIEGCLTDLDARTVEEALRAAAGPRTPGDDRTYEQRLADGLTQLCTAFNNGQVKGGRTNLPTILITIDINDLNGKTNGPGYTSRGDIIPAEAVRNLCANANIVRILLGDSMPLDIGRDGRYATAEQWKALVARDGGCRMDGCTMPAEWCQVDHIKEWEAEYGLTDIDWLVLWCVYHHHFRHRPDVHLIGDANNLSIQLPGGRIVPLPPRGPTHQQKASDASGTTGTSDQGTLFGDTAA